MTKKTTGFDLYRRFWIFSYSDYYPLGGIYDIILTSDDIEECYKNMMELYDEGIVDNLELFDSNERAFVKTKWDK